MSERPFLDKSNKPTEQALQTALGSTYPFYQEITSLAKAYIQEWSFYKSSGWLLKVHARKKSLFYLIPAHDGFKISLNIRAHERDAFLCDEELHYMREQLAESKKYPEGFALQFEIANADQFQLLMLFLTKLIAVRG